LIKAKRGRNGAQNRRFAMINSNGRASAILTGSFTLG
jgi:hypothetical protein